MADFVVYGNILNLGCGAEPLPRGTNHDISKHSSHVDVAHDLNVTPWPWSDGEFDSVLAVDVFEHLSIDVDAWINECHRILSDEGSLFIRVPDFRHENAYTDPTHRRFFTQYTFDYWDKSKLLHQKYGFFYYQKANRWWTVSSSKTDGSNLYFVLMKGAQQTPA
jgi:SAM-dependent methyltransferase